MADGIPTAEVARRLGTTAPTVRVLLERGELEGKKVRRGSRFAWKVDRSSLEAYEAQHGRFVRSRRGGTSRIGDLEDQLASLSQMVASSMDSGTSAPMQDERDALRAQ